MYGLVLMAALSTAPDTSSFGWGRGCTGYTGCTGCTGVVVGGCTGVSCYGGSCYGGSCFGSFQGGLFSRFRGLFAGRCHGCYSTCYGCSGSCMGSSCFGSSCVGSSCVGSSCVGSMNPPVVSGPFGPQAGVYYAEPGAVPNGHPVYPRTSFGYGVGCGSGPVYYGPDFHPPYGPCCEPGLGTVVIPPQVKIDNSGTGTEVTRAKPQAAPARLTIELPADAKLFVDGTLTKGEGTSRNFHTPDLPAGQTFYYELKAEVTVDGKTVTEAKTVLVKAGEAGTQTFGKLIAAVNKTGDVLAKK